MAKHDKPRRTINVDLFRQWGRLVRTGDPAKIAEKLNVSRPTVIKALTYGHAHRQDLVDGITRYFADRLLAEKEEAARLRELEVSVKTS